MSTFVSATTGLPSAPEAAGPEAALTPSTRVGHCWTVAGAALNLTVELRQPVAVAAVSLDHVPAEVTMDPGSAPREFTVVVRVRACVASRARARARRAGCACAPRPLPCPHARLTPPPPFLPTHCRVSRTTSRLAP